MQEVYVMVYGVIGNTHDDFGHQLLPAEYATTKIHNELFVHFTICKNNTI